MKQFTFNGLLPEWACVIHGGRNKDKRMQWIKDIDNPFRWAIISLAINMFKWENLPNNLESYMVELPLFWNGAGVFFDYSENKELVLPCAKVGEMDVYGRMQVVNPIAYNGEPLPMNIRVYDSVIGDEKRNGVFIMNNGLMLSTYAFLDSLIEGLIFIYQTKIQNLISSSRPVIVRTDKKTADAINNSFNKLFGDMDLPIKAVYTDGIINELEAIDLKVTYSQADYWDDFKNQLNLILSFLGIGNNNEIMKKERMNVPETQDNKELIVAFRESMLTYRQQACEKINETFGLNVSVKYAYEQEMEDVENGELLRQPTDTEQRSDEGRTE